MGEWNPRRVVLEPGSDEAVAIAQAVIDGEPVTLEIFEGYRRQVFERGDRVRVPFDDGPGYATIEWFDHRHVGITYGPGGRYRTSLERGSVQTDRTENVPARVKVVNNDGQTERGPGAEHRVRPDQ